MNTFAVFAFCSGAAIAVQAALNAQLGSLLKSPLLATCVAFGVAVMFTLAATLGSTRHYPSGDTLRAVPVYLWFSGGLLSALAISTFYYLIPKMGVGQMMSLR